MIKPDYFNNISFIDIFGIVLIVPFGKADRLTKVPKLLIKYLFSLFKRICFLTSITKQNKENNLINLKSKYIKKIER